jgi:hypothetical protein
MGKPQPPVFHIPVGRHRRYGAVVLFEDQTDQAGTAAASHDMTLNHPTTLGA